MRIAEAVAKEQGVEFYWIKYQNSPGYQRLQVLIDKEGGVSLSDCERVSRALGVQFDGQIHHSYELEVSSPGMERQLFIASHYRRAIGQTIQIKTFAPVSGQKVWSGLLTGVHDDQIDLQIAQGRLEIAIEQIANAHVTPNFDLS
ncbi:ribosome maturation factor RimP [Candidatus Acetothermia bacterium]|nr:ribosome maturation factor RimP [Candidatus Acetothermia bacterium]MBI3643546.1 ribosome maturation factor RimP [Candidatus Acetothermia bacterium]